MFRSYFANLRLSEQEGGRRYKGFLKTLQENELRVLPMSGVMRANAFDVLRYGYPLAPTGYTAAVFTAVTPDSSSHYAFAYWRRPDDQLPEYISVSPTFDSRDGEYRGRFILYSAFEEGYQKLQGVLSEMEGLALELVQEGKLRLEAAVYPSDREADLDVEGLRLTVRAFVAALVLDRRLDLAEIHANDQYRRVLKFVFGEQPGLGRELGAEELEARVLFLTGKYAAENRVGCGQKMTPLTVREATQPGDINFMPWREIYVDELCTDLVINGVAPNFPMYNQWSVVEGADEHLFENPAMREKYHRDQVARGAAGALKTARGAIPGRQEERFVQLDLKVFDAIRYAESFLLMSSVALLSTLEYTGVTAGTLPSLARRFATPRPEFARIFEEPEWFASFLFGVLYGAHQLHTRAGAIHADLHLHNMTYYRVTPAFRGAGESLRVLVPDPLVAYIAGAGEKDTYVFPHIGGFGCLIDFSRALLGPGARRRLEEERGVLYANAYYRDQVNRVFQTLHHYAPRFVEENQEKLKGMILAQPDAIFRTMGAVDFLAASRSLAALLEAERRLVETPPSPPDVRHLRVPEECLALCRKVEKAALDFLVTHLRDALGGVSEGELPFAGEIILPRAFGGYRFGAWSQKRLAEATLVDVYNARAPLTHSARDYARFPPWAKLGELEKHSGAKAEDVLERGGRPLLDALLPDPGLDILLEQLREEIERTPSAAGSSWIAE